MVRMILNIVICIVVLAIILCVLIGLILLLIKVRRYNKKKNNNKPVECPYCHIANANRLTEMDRTLSVVVHGVGSSKIGKQWHCNNCGSNF